MAHILIIDDEPQIRLMLRIMLESEGYTVTEAADGAEGLKSYREKPADLVITDLLMPHKEGLETITALKKDYPAIKIIAISGGGKNKSKLYLQMAQRFGALEVFEKPLRKEPFLECVRKLI